MSLENSELYGSAGSGIGNQFSVKGQILDILGFEGHVVSVETLKVTAFLLTCEYGCV